jgi:hypothetical protein
MKVIGEKGKTMARTGLLNLLYGVGNFGKIWSAYWQQEFKYTQ